MSAPVLPLIKQVAVLTGAAGELVTHRELRTRYCTNKSIKTWATYFLLKSLTSSGCIINWTAQKKYLLDYCHCTENSFRARLNELQSLKLISVTKQRAILLTSFETAADILGIPYAGTTNIYYDDSLPGKQIFQYFLRAEEIRSNQEKQLNALWYYAGKNPLLKDALIQMLHQSGCDNKRLQHDLRYFQTQLLRLQQHAFEKGSPLFDIIHKLRADINRSVKTIQKEHRYKSAQSVSYMKMVMAKMKIITINKICIHSSERSRLYVSDAETGKRRDAYKYLSAKKVTAWFLTDQISPTYKIYSKPKQDEKVKAA